MAADTPHIFVAGLSHRTAPVTLREKLAPSPEQARKLIQDVVTRFPGPGGARSEAVLVSTCNRFELYGVTGQAMEMATITGLIREILGVDLSGHPSAVYLHEGPDVAVHLLRVAASLDSLVVGEAQILGQVKEAYRVAVETGTSGKILNRLFHRAFEAGKRVRTETRIGHNAVSVSYAAVELAKRIFGRVEGKRVLVIGVGEMSELVSQHLKSAGVGELVVTNRTLQGAVNMADRHGGRAIEFSEFRGQLDQMDIVISATGSPVPIIGVAEVQQALGRRKQRPLFLIDIAVPRDIEAAVGELPNAYLFNIDDLQTVADKNYRERIAEAERAETLVRDEAVRFERWLRQLRATPLLERIRSLSETLVGEELTRLAWRLDRMEEREQRAITAAIQGIVNKVLHRPLVNIKRLAQEEEADLFLEVVENLFFEEPVENDDSAGRPMDPAQCPVLAAVPGATPAAKAADAETDDSLKAGVVSIKA